MLQNLSFEHNYGVIVDCGSSGSRAHIFRWNNVQNSISSQIELVRDETNGQPLTKHIEPGVSAYKDNPDKASDYMEPIMEFISKSVPEDRHIDTPIYFMATAGLRLLDDSTQKKLLTDLTRDLRIKFNFPKIKSQVISGEFEGIYSWLSLNMKGRLYNTTQMKPSYGMIEMGGASAQITFELEPGVENAILKRLPNNEAISAFKKEQRILDLGPGNSVKLFATTFLGLGVNTARESAIDLLVLDNLKQSNNDALKSSSDEELSKFEVRLKDPCLTSGSSEIVSRPIALLQKSNQNGRMTIGFVIKENEKTFKTRLQGTGDFFECKNLLERVLKLVKEEKLNCPLGSSSSPCPMVLLGTNFIPFSDYPFIGLSEMYFTTNEMMNLAGEFNRTTILQETKRICETQYSRLIELYSGEGASGVKPVTHQDRILYECFKATWLISILHAHGFNMPEDYNDFRTLDRLAGEEIDWTIGAMVTEVALNKFS